MFLLIRELKLFSVYVCVCVCVCLSGSRNAPSPVRPKFRCRVGVGQ